MNETDLNDFVDVVMTVADTDYTLEGEADTLAYRDGIVEQLQDMVEAYLEFGTTKGLIKIIADTI